MRKYIIPSKDYEINPEKTSPSQRNNSNIIRANSPSPSTSFPNGSKPHQRISGKSDGSALALNLQIHASSSYVLPNSELILDQGSSEPIQKHHRTTQAEGRRLGDRLQPTSNPKSHSIYDPKLDDESLFKKTLEAGVSEAVRHALINHKLSQTDFRPLKAPFVPNIIRILVNSIERDCETQSWSTVFTPSDPSQMEPAELHACLLLQNKSYPDHIKRQVNAMSLSLKVDTLRVLLASFKQKPLHFSKQILKEIVKRPLYDLFLRPNMRIKDLVRQACLPNSRTTIDTLAFMMFHLHHAWKSCVSSMANKTTLAKIYGPLLVSFSERPVITDQDPTNYKTEEAAILEVILEVCDLRFWDNLSMLKIHQAFKNDEEESKVQVVEPSKDNVNKTYAEPAAFENEAWFSCLFGPKESPSNEEQEVEEQVIEDPWGPSIFAKCTFTQQCIKSTDKRENQHGEVQMIEASYCTVGNKTGAKNVQFCKLPHDIKEYPRKHLFLSKNPRSTQTVLKDIESLKIRQNRRICPS